MVIGKKSFTIPKIILRKISKNIFEIEKESRAQDGNEYSNEGTSKVMPWINQTNTTIIPRRKNPQTPTKITKTRGNSKFLVMCVANPDMMLEIAKITNNQCKMVK